MSKYSFLKALCILVCLVISSSLLADEAVPHSVKIQDIRKSLSDLAKEIRGRRTAILRSVGSNLETEVLRELNDDITQATTLLMGTLGMLRLREAVGAGCANAQSSMVFALHAKMYADLVKVSEQALVDNDDVPRYSSDGKAFVSRAVPLVREAQSELFAAGKEDAKCFDESNRQFKGK